MLPNEEFALACRAYYEEQGFIVDQTNGQFAHSPLTRKECDTGYYLLWEHHQHQGLLQSRDLNKCCFFAPDTLKWLKECDYFPSDFFDLWDVYDNFKGWAVSIMSEEDKKKGRGKLKEKISEYYSTLSEDERKEKTAHLNTLEVITRRGKSISNTLNGRTELEKKLHYQKIVESRGVKRVEITFPDGRRGEFSSVKLAAEWVGVSQKNVWNWIYRGKRVTQKKYRGFAARYI
jgi:hypothetical protein